MTDVEQHPLAEGLRRGAKGRLMEEAAVELLLAGSSVRRRDVQSYIQIASGQRIARVHWTHLAAGITKDSFGADHPGEIQLLRIACALGSDEVQDNLGDMIADLDVQHLHLVMQALARARGWHAHGEQPGGEPGISRTVDGRVERGKAE